MSSLSFVRDNMLEQQPAPKSQIGLGKWLQSNLFTGWLNIILTLLAVAAVAFVVYHLAPWFLHSVWDAQSLKECRTIITSTWGNDATGACFAVINDRWEQLLYGAYPRDMLWRPNLTVALFLLALIPILVQRCPRIFLLGSFIYPAIAYWLLWGGSLWHPLMTLAGFAIGAFVLWTASRSPKMLVALIAAVSMYIWWKVAAGNIVALLEANYPVSHELSDGSIWPAVVEIGGFVVGFAIFWLLSQASLSIAAVLSALIMFTWWQVGVGSSGDTLEALHPIDLPSVRSHEFGGFMLSMLIGVSGIIASLPLGILLALGRQSDMPLLNKVCVGFIEFIRGVPLITLLFTASTLLNYFLPPGTSFDLILRVIIMVILFSAGYIAEVIRGGLAALPKGQYEAADALGLDYWKAQRLIIMPQALKVSIPGIVSTFIGLFKDTTLVVFIGLLDPIGLTGSIRADSDWNGIYWELFIFIGLLFFIFCFSMSRYSQYLERQLKTDHQ